MIYTKRNIYDVPKTAPGGVPVKLTGVDYYGNSVELFLTDLSTVFVGAPGVGKTTQIIHCIDTSTQNPDAVTVILDIKGEYLEKCFKPGDVVLSMYDLSHIPKENQLRWCLMKEALLDSNPESVLFEIAQMVFKKARETSQNPVFATAAMLVFYGQLVHVFRSCNGKIPFNSELITKIESVSDAEIFDSVSRYADLFAVRDLVSKKTNLTSFGIKMELRTILMETFILGSNFCSSDSRFSIREFIHEGRGRKLFIEFDFANRESSGTIIRLLLDLALKEALSGSCLEKGDKTRYNFFLDEYGYLPSGLSYLDAIKEVGRSKGCRIYAGFQSINQLHKLYNGRADMAADDFSSFSNIIAFRTHDKESMTAITDRCGCEYNEVTTIDALCNVYTETKLVSVISDDTLVGLKQGEAIVILDTGRPFWIKFDK